MPADSRGGARFDAIVVGGGLAGVTAARDLAHSGMRTLLVEARDRLGGRTAVQTIAGREVDTGGTYFGWLQPALWHEVMRYELPVVESDMLAVESYLTSDSETEISAEELDERLRRGYSAFWGDPAYAAALVRPFAIHTDPRAAELDAMSVEDRLQKLDLDPRDEHALRGMLSDFGRPEEASLAWVLQRMANGFWSHEGFSALFAIYRIEGGMASLVDAMVRHGGFEVMLSSPVAAIEHDDTGATVVLEDGSDLSAAVVVVATPVNVWKTIAFAPTLSEAHEAATQEGVAMPAVSNMIMHVRGVSGRVAMLAPFGTQPFEIMATYSLLDVGQLIAGYSLNGEVTCAGGHEQVQEALHRTLPTAELVEFVGHDWRTDPYALGGWGRFRVGQTLRFLDVLDQPIGPLFFASADIAPHYPGLLTGAIESGARAAHRARLAVSSGV